MQFQSTRDPNTIVSSSEAILRGLAPDGGLFVPTAFPKAELIPVVEEITPEIEPAS